MGPGMGRLLWPLVLVVTFAAGLGAGRVIWKEQSAVQEAQQQEAVTRLEEKVSTLQARLRARDDLATARPPGTTGSTSPLPSSAGSGANRFMGAAVTGGGAPFDSPARAGGAIPQPSGPPRDRPAAPPASRAATPAVQAALERFYKYLELTNATEGRERFAQARELVNELRGMGDAAGQALMHVLAAGGDSDERRAAARLLGTLQYPQALPLLRDVIEKDNDLMLRRAAAMGLRQLQTADSLPVMERILANPNEDRFVRLSVASGLADSGRPHGVTGLTQIFEEATADGRGRDLAFRALASLTDQRGLPFMRQIAASPVEPGYRLRAIRYLTTQGDRQALGALQTLMHSPNEQASIRDAAAQAYSAINAK
jgi:hypothetical protein